MFRVFADHLIIGDDAELEDAKQRAERWLDVPELIWNYSGCSQDNIWWSDEKDGGERVGCIMYIFEVPDVLDSRDGS